MNDVRTASFQLPGELRARVQRVTEETDVPFSAIVRRALVEYLDRRDAKNSDVEKIPAI